MTVASTTNRNTYTGNGATATYDYTFRIFAEADLLVTIRDTDGAETTKVLTTDYTVAGEGDVGGGSITLVAGNLTTNYIITLRRVMDLTQETDIRNQGSYFPETHEDTFDTSRMIDQQLQDQIDRCIKVPETEDGSTAATVLDQATDRASKYFAWDASGNPIASDGGAVGYLITISDFAKTYLDDLTAAATLTTLGFSTFIQTLINDADATTARATLGVTPANLGISAYGETLVDDANASAALSTLGFSAFGKTIIDDADGGAVMTTLGITAFAQTMLDDVDAAAVRATLGITSFDAATYYMVEQAVAANVTSATYVIVTGMTVTPAAGTYKVSFNGEMDTPAGGGIQEYVIYSAGAAVTNSERRISAGNAYHTAQAETVVTVNGSQAVAVYSKTDTATMTWQKRALILVKVTTP